MKRWKLWTLAALGFVAGFFTPDLCRADQKLEEAVLISSAAFDLISGEVGIQTQGYESNPLMGSSPVQRIAVKAGSTALILLLARKLQPNHPKLASVLRFSGITLWTTAGAWNVSLTLSR